MELIILGSGATQPPPRPYCECNVCKEARKKGIPYLRTGPSLFIKDVNVLIDTPGEIRLQLTREKIKRVDAVFYTHWHPDHTIGCTIFEQMNWNLKKWKAIRATKVFFPKGSLDDLRKYKLSGVIDYAIKLKTIDAKEINENSVIKFKRILIRPIKIGAVWGYSIEEGKKKILYAPCDIMDLPKLKLKNYDLFIIELGWLRKRLKGKENELLSFYDILEAIKKFKPKNVIFSHIEENRGSHKELKKLEKKYKRFNVKIAYDGMKVKI